MDFAHNDAILSSALPKEEARTAHEGSKHTKKEWEEQKEEIARLYENDTLQNVAAFMKEQHGFEASQKQFKDHIKKWGLKKNIQPNEMEIMLKKQRERKAEKDKETAFILRGRPVDQAKIDRYKRDHATELEDNAAYEMDIDSSPQPTPTDIKYYTPADTSSMLPQDSASPVTESAPQIMGFTRPQSNAQPALPPRPGTSHYQTPPSQQTYGYLHSPPQQYGGYGGGTPNKPQYERPDMPSVNSNGYTNGDSLAPPPPPEGLQSFESGAPEDYAFQYSKCTGRRKALLIGINYFGQRGQLRGCINDVKNMSSFLHENFGYQRDDMVILTDDQQNPMSQPTKQNILRAMHWLVKDAKTNDSLFFHYSGHGGQTKDLNGSSEDGYDEVIYPVDFRVVGHIVDNEMYRILVDTLQPGVRLTALFDSCHSASALELPYIYSTQGILKERDAAHGKSVATKTSPADVIMLSCSRSYDTSYDSTVVQATGAMSWAFVNSIKKNAQQSMVQLLHSIRDELATKYTQKPQLSCSHPLNTNLLFVM